MAKRIAVANNKGGCGKTTVTVALAEAAARLGLRVLVVDMDPQGNGTRRLRVGVRATLTECLRYGLSRGEAQHYLHRHGWGGADEVLAIDVLPADLDLEDRAVETGQPGADLRLRKALFGMDDDYDLTLIDCPPSIGTLTRLSIAALDGPVDTVLVPLRPEFDDVAGAQRIVTYVQQYREDLGVPNLAVHGVIANGVRANTILHGGRIEQLDTAVGVPTVAVVPQLTRIAEVQDAACPLGSDLALLRVLSTFEQLVGNLLPRQVVR